MEHETLNDFLWNTAETGALGAIPFAKSLGKDKFFVTGENLVNGAPFDESTDQDVAAYQGSAAAPEVPYPLNFSLAWDIRSVFTEGLPTSALTFRFESQKKHFKDLAYLPNFIDSHDIDRFLRAGSPGAFQQALAMVFTIPGIPTVLYGTEQNFTQTRAAMFAAGFDSGKQDHFNPQSPSYQWIQKLAQLRKSSQVFTRGTLKVIKDNASGAGVFAYMMDNGTEKALVVFNSSTNPSLGDNLPTGLPAGAVLESALTNASALEAPLTAAAGGLLSLELPGQSVGVYFFKGKTAGVPAQTMTAAQNTLKSGQVVGGNLAISGTSSKAEKVQLVIDGNLSKAVTVALKADGTWTGTLDAENLASGPHTLNLRLESQGAWTVTPGVNFKVDIPFKTVVQDGAPVVHRKGPEGKYLYPTDGTFKTQMDIEAVEIATAGKNLRITVKPKGGISTSWNPQYGFDHVSYNIFIGLPGQKGASVMPRQNGSVPEGFTWNYMVLAGGWANFLYSAEGASATSYGKTAKPAAQIQVDKEKGTISFTIQAEALGFPATLSGTRIYLNTWDYDGIESSNRKLEAKPQAYIMGGGDGSKDVLYMEDTKVFVVP